MAFTTVVFTNPNNGFIKEAPVGFSWTVMFFGIFPPLLRSDWKWAFIMFIAGLITFGFSHLIFIFVYNKLYIKDLIGSGYKAKFVAMGNMDFISAKIGMQIPMLESAES